MTRFCCSAPASWLSLPGAAVFGAACLRRWLESSGTQVVLAAMGSHLSWTRLQLEAREACLSVDAKC